MMLDSLAASISSSCRQLGMRDSLKSMRNCLKAVATAFTGTSRARMSILGSSDRTEYLYVTHDSPQPSYYTIVDCRNCS